jgi:hypothetical protein
MGRSQAEVPKVLTRAAARFEAWRAGHTSRRPLPAALWDRATEVAARHGVHRTARTLRLNYYDLKERVERRGPAAMAAPAFVEVRTAPPARDAKVLVEFEDARGAKMRIHLKGGGTPDLAALGRIFLGGRA